MGCGTSTNIPTYQTDDDNNNDKILNKELHIDTQDSEGNTLLMRSFNIINILLETIDIAPKN